MSRFHVEIWYQEDGVWKGTSFYSYEQAQNYYTSCLLGTELFILDPTGRTIRLVEYRDGISIPYRIHRYELRGDYK